MDKHRERSRVTRDMRKNLLLRGLGAAVLLLIAYAWIDGGERPLGEISQTVAVPGAAQ